MTPASLFLTKIFCLDSGSRSSQLRSEHKKGDYNGKCSRSKKRYGQARIVVLLLRAMSDLFKAEFPPLLQPGFHTFTLQELQVLCVDAFPLSRTRPLIMVEFEKLVRTLHESGFRCEIWADGSFLTEKIDPDDIDLVVTITSDFEQNATPDQNKAIALLELYGIDPKKKSTLRCQLNSGLSARPLSSRGRRRKPRILAEAMGI